METENADYASVEHHCRIVEAAIESLREAHRIELTQARAGELMNRHDAEEARERANVLAQRLTVGISIAESLQRVVARLEKMGMVTVVADVPSHETIAAFIGGDR